MIDRLSIRSRPPGWPMMYQSWGKLLFMHWEMPEELLRPLLPERLTLDTWEGRAWIGVVPFTMSGVRPILLPALPGLSDSHELNVRTYVHLDGVPGVWFFSLDASNAAAVRAARFLFHLPYFRARMRLLEDAGAIRFTSRRRHFGAPAAEFEASWIPGEALPETEPGSLDFFLTERYCLYAASRRNLYRARIHHPPWPLQRAELLAHSSTMLPSHGLPQPSEPPLLHYAESLQVAVWPPERV